MWDRHIHLVYKGVKHYRLETPKDMADPPGSAVGHGDLLAHEIVQVRDELFSHELIFSTGATLFIRFADLEHRIQLIGG